MTLSLMAKWQSMILGELENQVQLPQEKSTTFKTTNKHITEVLFIVLKDKTF